jgi:hypothetical protein
MAGEERVRGIMADLAASVERSKQPRTTSSTEPFTCRWCDFEMTTEYLWCPKCGTVPEHITFAEVESDG